jgi:antirestriction protein ArdC
VLFCPFYGVPPQGCAGQATRRRAGYPQLSSAALRLLPAKPGDGDEGYAREELVAELGSAFLAADIGIVPEVRKDHAAYIQSWLQALKDDKRLIFAAAAHAQRVVDSA